MVTCTCVRGSTLAGLAMVLVLATSGEPSTRFPLETRRAGAPPLDHFFKFSRFLENFKNFDPERQLFETTEIISSI